MQWEKVAEVPDEWKEGLLIKLAKSGNLRECYNYRGIVLLSIPGKVFRRILLDRQNENCSGCQARRPAGRVP